MTKEQSTRSASVPATRSRLEDDGDRGELDRSDEGGHVDEQLALRVGEQANGPFDDIEQRAVTSGTVPAAEDAERLVELIAKAGQSESRHAGGGELEHQRQTVEATDDLGDDSARPVGHVVRRDGLEAVEEQPSRVILGEWRKDRQRAHRRRAAARATGQQDVGGADCGDPVGDDRDALGEVLAVVEHDEHPLPSERIGDLVEQRLAGCHGQPQIVGDHGRDVGGIAQRAELDPDDTVRVPVTDRVRGVAGQPSLADTSRTDDGHHTAHRQQLVDAFQSRRDRRTNCVGAAAHDPARTAATNPDAAPAAPVGASARTA